MQYGSPFAELSDAAKALLIQAYQNGEPLDAPLYFLDRKEDNPRVFDGRPSDELQDRGWLIDVAKGRGKLSDKAKAALQHYRESLGTASLSDSRIKHVLAAAYLAVVERTDARSLPTRLIRECNLGREGMVQIRQLAMQGYLRLAWEGVSLTEAGKELGKQILEEAQSKQGTVDDKFSKRWTNRKSEGERFLRWAWQQHRGDLYKPINARAYVLEQRRTFYDLMALLEWTNKEGFTAEPEEFGYINKHAATYWDVPLNLTFPHEYRVSLTAKGEAEGARLYTEHKARFKRWGKGIVEMTTTAQKFLGALALLATAVAGYFIGKGNAASSPQPTTQAVVSPATPAAAQPTTAASHRTTP